MFDTMTLTKIGGSLTGALLVFLLGNWFAESIYSGGHAGDATQGYVIEVASADDADAADAPATEGPTFADLYAAADPEAGEKLTRACTGCHSFAEGRIMTGPSLHGVVGRAPGTAEGFSYSAGFADLNAGWTPEDLDHFITAPREYAPSTKMTYSGMRDATDRANLIAYLATLSN